MEEEKQGLPLTKVFNDLGKLPPKIDKFKSLSSNKVVERDPVVNMLSYHEHNSMGEMSEGAVRHQPIDQNSSYSR